MIKYKLDYNVTVYPILNPSSSGGTGNFMLKTMRG